MSQKLPVHRHQSEDTIDELKARVSELEARILTMSTVENNLRAGLEQLSNPWVSVDDENKPEVGQQIWSINHRGFREAYLYNSYLFDSAKIMYWAPEPQLPISEGES